ncbi:MAG: hypothetical protein E6Q97_06240 [Desulfurellales bacterium]|nr:MAG: hypothetical protein E6Q97_06240 [Desulfurellales bacterium]
MALKPEALQYIEEIKARIDETTPGPWNGLRVGRVGNGSARSYEAQICNEEGIAVVIVTHDGSAEALANVDFMMKSRFDIVALYRMVEELETENVRLRATISNVEQFRKSFRIGTSDGSLPILNKLENKP